MKLDSKTGIPPPCLLFFILWFRCYLFVLFTSLFFLSLFSTKLYTSSCLPSNYRILTFYRYKDTQKPVTNNYHVINFFWFNAEEAFVLAASVSCTPTWPRGYKTFFVLNSVEHEILNAHKYKNIKKFGLFKAQLSLECYFSRSYMLKCQQLLAF